ncbi:mycofactocin-coupled SDR family oxidoreductase [Gordonia sp. DT30]|uniref:mycofactocin-coupled SDR family oxidoreductase n=1 Tax=unclassified Gordonia (in: high G+C Gram-positive bacteria) TaxID=2657482 RepID=UPI003CF9789E
MGRLDGKIAFITGVARGQGRAHAIRLAREGAQIIGIDLAGPLPGVPYDSATPEDLEETRRLVEEEGGTAVLTQCDVRDADGVTAAVAAGVERFGGLDIVVANAGICIPQTWDEITPSSFGDTLDINVTGVWNTVTATVGHLIARGGGSVIITSSYAGKKVQPFMIHYTTSKHALVGMTRGLAAELGAHNIRVNSVHPGAVNTPMGSGSMQERIETTNQANPRLAGMGTVFVNRYAAEAEDIANVVAFLASDESTFVTAEHISVDGGAQHY